MFLQQKLQICAICFSFQCVDIRLEESRIQLAGFIARKGILSYLILLSGHVQGTIIVVNFFLSFPGL